MSLEDLIKKSPPTGRGKGGGRGGRSGGRAGGAIKRGGVARASRDSSAPYKKPVTSTATLSSMTSKTQAVSKAQTLKAAGGLTTGAKLKVSNLDFAVSSQDIEELFSEIGEVKSAEVMTGPNGSSKGIAFVVYKKKADAEQAIEHYNGVPLDGKPLRISLVPTVAASTPAASIQISSTGGRGGRTVVVTNGTSGAGRGAVRGGGRSTASTTASRGTRGRGSARGKGGRASSRGRGRGKSEEPPASADDLDADLEAYKAAASA